MTNPDQLTSLLRQYADINFELLRDHEEQAIADSLTAAGFHVVRTAPSDVAAVNPATFVRLRAALDTMATSPWTPSPAAKLSGWPVVQDGALPDGEVHFRPAHTERTGQ